MYGSTVAVVDTKTIKYPGHGLSVMSHVLPQPGRILGAAPQILQVHE